MNTSKTSAWCGFTLRDIATIAVLGALTFVLNLLTSPLHAIRIFGLPTLATAPIYGFFTMFVLTRVRKPGTLLLYSFCAAAISLAMRPMSFAIGMIAGAIAEAIVLSMYRSYEAKAARYTGAILRPLLQLPVQVGYSILILGRSFERTVQFNAIVAVVLVGTVLLAVLSAVIADKVASELARSGRMA